MLRGRLALGSVYLCFVCLLTVTPQPAARLCTKDTIKRVQVLIDKAPNLKWLNSTLYTPTIDDYQNCPRSTLKCFADEIKVLNKEWQTIKGFHKLNIKLEKLAEYFNQTESECRQCELLKEEEAEQFLRELQLTLWIMNNEELC